MNLTTIMNILKIPPWAIADDLHPKLGASKNESAYGSVPDPFPSPLKMGKGRQRQTNVVAR